MEIRESEAGVNDPRDQEISWLRREIEMQKLKYEHRIRQLQDELAVKSRYWDELAKCEVERQMMSTRIVVIKQDEKARRG